MINKGYLLNNVTTAPSTGSQFDTHIYLPGSRSIQATVNGTGAVSATISIDVSNGDGWWASDAAVITLSGTTSVTDGFEASAPWPLVRARLTAISGTNAACTVTICGRTE